MNTINNEALTMRLESLQISRAVNIESTGTSEWWDKTWTSGFMKQPVDEPVWLSYEGFKGDEQADRRNHGGIDKAVCVYSSEHYDFWKQRLELPMAYGAFGENLTVSGMTEESVRVGDIYAVGDVRLQVSQPRQPCWKLSRRWRVKDLNKQVEDTGFTGFYFRVLKHGLVTPGATLELCERGEEAITVEYCNRIRHHEKRDAEAALRLSNYPALSGSWKDSFYQRYRSLTAR